MHGSTADPSWRDHGAVALNNPHNATGRIFNLDGMRRLVQGLLIRNVCILDDLSYQNVAPVDGSAGHPARPLYRG